MVTKTLVLDVTLSDKSKGEVQYTVTDDQLSQYCKDSFDKGAEIDKIEQAIIMKRLLDAGRTVQLNTHISVYLLFTWHLVLVLAK